MIRSRKDEDSLKVAIENLIKARAHMDHIMQDALPGTVCLTVRLDAHNIMVIADFVNLVGNRDSKTVTATY